MLNIYGMAIMEEVHAAVRTVDKKLRPHVYSIAAAALNNMRQENKDQCVLISGESGQSFLKDSISSIISMLGAGKTEATKKILQYISTMSKSSSSRAAVSVESQILDSNPILESFGNAKTIRNNNSSRFGKYMEINFDSKNNIKGCSITSYLLEKTRVVKLSSPERNYHIFYMLVAGASSALRKDLYLKPADAFVHESGESSLRTTNYFNREQGGCLTIDRRSDSEEFQQLLTAMESLGFDSTFRENIFRCLAGILHLGNLEFSKKGDEGSSISSSDDCERVAELIGFSDPSLLEIALCFRENIVNKETFMIPLLPAKAKDQRDALAKYIYGRIFDIIVLTVNQSLFRGKHGRNIGVLDIFGFEVFKENSFVSWLRLYEVS